MFLLVAGIITSCSNKIAKPNFLNKEDVLKKIERQSYPESKDYPDDDNLLIYYDTQVEIKYMNRELVQVIKVHVIKKLFKNLIENSKTSIALGETDELLYLEGRTLNRDTVSSFLKKDDISTIVLKSGGEELENKIINFTFQNVQENSIVEYFYVIKSVNSYMGRIHEIQLLGQPVVFNNFSLSMDNTLREYSNFVYATLSSSDSRFSNNILFTMLFTKPLSISYSINANGINGNTVPIVFKTEDNSTFTWTFKDVPSFEPEEDMLPINFLKPKIEFQPTLVNDWNDIVSPYIIELNKIIDETDYKAIIKKKDEILKGEQDKLRKIELITDYVRNIRYEANRFGEGGTIPMSPEKVLSKGYGDCKDKSFLLCNLLRQAHIEAYPVLVMTNDEDIISKDIPVWKFNHMIVKVFDSDKIIWIDPTVTRCKLGEIPANIQGVGAIPLNPHFKYGTYRTGNVEFEIIPENTYYDNNLKFSYDMNIFSNDSIFYKVNLICKGEFGLMMRNIKYEGNDNIIKDFIKDMMKDEFKNVELSELKFSNLDDYDNPVIIEFSFSALKKIKKITKNLFSIDVDPFITHNKSKWLNQNKKRKHPVYFNFIYSISKEAVIHLEEDVKFVELANSDELENEFFHFNRFLVTDDNKKIEFSEFFANKKIYILTEEYDNAKKLFSDMKNIQSNGLVVEIAN